MTALRKTITRDDILDLETYEVERPQRRARLREIKRNRRVEVGPCATFYFENYDTMLHQVHEMLRIEKGGDEQLLDELSAYNPLIPQGRDLVATLMFGHRGKTYCRARRRRGGENQRRRENLFHPFSAFRPER